jgi:RES domain-containing protein
MVGRTGLTQPISGTIYRIVFEHLVDKIMDGVLSPEGRFHHDGEAAFYCSPTPQAASIAIDRYVGDDDPPRVLCQIAVENADVFDLRTAVQTTDHIDPAWGSVHWAPERAAGQRATTWRASDAVRALDVDGMVYTSRTAPDRWHLLLFRWNELGGPKIRLLGSEEWFVDKYPKPAL